MSNQDLVQAVKKCHELLRAGQFDQAYNAYRDLFSSPVFATYRPEDQRQALRLMIHAKGVPSLPTSPMVESHNAAIAPLSALISNQNEPVDYEMLGMCYRVVGNISSADAVFREGFSIERMRNPQSDLCNTFMRHISQL